VDLLGPWLPLLGTLSGATIVLVAVHLALVRRAPSSRFVGQVVLLLLTLVALVAVVAALPISEGLRGQLVGLIGVVASATIALSSTTFVGNAMGGLMLRALRNFRPGDFVRVGEHFGRVSERGLFHTELQTEDSDLTTIPNLYLVTNPVTVIRGAGTIVSAQVSLGYDVPRRTVEAALLRAAAQAGLEEAFVQLVELGDFSVLYRVAGLLKEVTTLLSARSHLRSSMLDALHEDGVEIVSPTFMNTRSIPTGNRFVPAQETAPRESPSPASASPEAIVFEKADVAAVTEQLKDQVSEVDRELKQLEHAKKEAEPEERDVLKRRVEELEVAREQLAEELQAREDGETDPHPPSDNPGLAHSSP
jgi:small-conductance mechanosensitive channel